jgi:hypothetical protein
MAQENETKSEKLLQEASRFTVGVLSVMEALTRVMDREVVLMEQQNGPELVATREEKTKWMSEYRITVNALMQKPALFQSAKLEDKKRLRLEAEKLDRAAHRNAVVLKAAVGATQALIQTVITAARDQNKISDCYVDPRKTPLMLGSYSPLCNPIAVSRTA